MRAGLDRGQTKGLTRKEGRRGGAQLEASDGEEFKGGKRLRGRRGGAGKGKRPKGAGSSGRAEGSTGERVAGEGEGKKTGKVKNSYEFRESVYKHEQSEEGEAHDYEAECLGGGSGEGVGHTDLAGGEGMDDAAPRSEAAEGSQWEAHTERLSRAGEERQASGEVCGDQQAADASVGHGVGVGGSEGSEWGGSQGGVSPGVGAAVHTIGAVAACGHGIHRV